MKKYINKKNIIIIIIVFMIGFSLLNNYIQTNQSSNNLEKYNTSNADHKEKSEATDNKDSNKQYIDLEGAIKNPGMYEFSENDRLGNIVEKAGGLDNANKDCINLAQKLTDGVRIYIPHSDEKCEKQESNSQNDEASSANIEENNDLVDINNANEQELMTLDGIGESKAQAIIEYREKTPFKTKEDLKNVNGIGDVTYENIQDKITV